MMSAYSKENWAILRFLRRARVRRFTSVQLLVSLLAFLVFSPMAELSTALGIVESVLMTTILISALAVVGVRRRLLILSIILVVPPFLGRWALHLAPDLLPAGLPQATTLIFVVLVIVQLLRIIVRAHVVDTEMLCAGLSVYLMIGLAWALVYQIVAAYDPKAFVNGIDPETHIVLGGFTSAYFSFVTLTTMGYGDILPLSNIARMLAMLEAIVGVLFLATMISRLVSLSLTPPQSPTPHEHH
jgi:hypothetical protein